MVVNWGEGGGHGVKIVPKDGCTGLFKILRKFYRNVKKFLKERFQQMLCARIMEVFLVLECRKMFKKVKCVTNFLIKKRV